MCVCVCVWPCGATRPAAALQDEASGEGEHQGSGALSAAREALTAVRFPLVIRWAAPLPRCLSHVPVYVCTSVCVCVPTCGRVGSRCPPGGCAAPSRRFTRHWDPLVPAPPAATSCTSCRWAPSCGSAATSTTSATCTRPATRRAGDGGVQQGRATHRDDLVSACRSCPTRPLHPPRASHLDLPHLSHAYGEITMIIIDNNCNTK